MASANKSTITLKGSVELVTEFFYYAVNSVLYQRGIYPPDEFEQTKKYGLPLLISKDKGVKQFIDRVMAQSSEWLMKNDIKKLVIVIMDLKTGESRERWSFDVETDVQAVASGTDKSDAEIRAEIAQIIKQITSSVTYLPLLQDACKFDVLVYTRKDAETPENWELSQPHLIQHPEQVRLRNFNTKIHKVETSVAYLTDA